MLVSKRLFGLYNMMYGASFIWNSVSSLSRRMIALGVLSEMRITIDQLEELNNKLEYELSVEDADIDFNIWFEGEGNDNIQCFFNSNSYIEEEETTSIIHNTPTLFPSDKSATYNDKTESSIIYGLLQLNSEAVLNHADIREALISGFGRIISLLGIIKNKMTNIPDELYENYCYDFFARDLDLVYQDAERNYETWKDEQEWKSQQALEDKRTQEILNLLVGGIVSHAAVPTNREMIECPIKILEEALVHNTHIPDNIEMECARFAKFVSMKNCIMWIDYTKLGRYLYKHYKDLSYDEMYLLKKFYVTLDFIHHDMASLNTSLKIYLPDYEDEKLETILDNAIQIINKCKPYLSDNNPEDVLEKYLRDAFYGDVKQEVQKILGRKGIYSNICKMLGMLRSSTKIFKLGTTPEQLASCLSELTSKPSQDSMVRKINEGASDKNSKLRMWTDNYIKENCYSESTRLFLDLATQAKNT